MALASIEAALDLSASVRSVPAALNTASPTFTINVTVRNCDVVYVETTQRVDSRAFIIRLSTMLEFVARDNEQVLCSVSICGVALLWMGISPTC